MAACTEEGEFLTPEDKLFVLQISLQEKVNSCGNESEKISLIHKYLSNIVSDGPKVYVPDFDTGLEWLNTSREISLKNDLSKKIVVLDFFTYCCINCMHILPDLHALEEKCPANKGLAVVGVHSAKFENERVLANVADAVLRYDIAHPVVNDPDAILWTKLQVQCWPTLIILGPGNQLIFKLVGENNRDLLMLFCETSIAFFKDQLDFSPLPTKLLKNSMKTTHLFFPGKLSVNKTEDCIAVSDTGHHRVLIITMQGVVKEVIGTGKPGLSDGNFESCQFKSPQGVAWKGCDGLYVADTENHSIRMVDFTRRTVSTIVGTGKQGTDKEGGCSEVDLSLNSPWDLCFAPDSKGCDGGVLFIAMAGSHQIWAYFLSDTTLFKRSYTKSSCVSIAGSGIEENRNNSYPNRAGFAQPSGITLKGEEDELSLYVADSESSSIREINLNTGVVRAIAGGDRDPKNLFAFGDKDGIHFDAKLQHPLGVVWCSQEKLLYVADSYNHKIKVVNPKTKECTTLSGTGDAGNQCGQILESQFNEPGGLCVCSQQKLLLVADTNNHALKMIDFGKQMVKEIAVMFLEQKKSCDVVDCARVVKKVQSTNTKEGRAIALPKLLVAPGHKIFLHSEISLDSGLALTEGAPHKFQVHLPGSGVVMATGSTTTKLDLVKQPKCCLCIQGNGSILSDLEIKVAFTVYVCQKKSGCCFSRNVTFFIPLEMDYEMAPKDVHHKVKLAHKVSV